MNELDETELEFIEIKKPMTLISISKICSHYSKKTKVQKIDMIF